MLLPVQVAEPVAARRRLYFDLRLASGGVDNGEAAGQPQISVNGAAWTNVGIGTLNLIGNGAYYADLTTGILALGSYITGRFQAGANPEHRSRNDVFVVNYDPWDVPAAVDAAISANHGTGDYTGAGIITGSAPGAAAVAVNSPLSQYSGSLYQQTFNITGIAGAWTAAEFSIKRNKETDDDNASLILAKVSNPGAGGDGLVRLNGNAAPSAAGASIVVTPITGGLSFLVTVNASSFVIPPDEDTAYQYELKRWNGANDIAVLAQGDFTVLRPVIRSVTP